MWWVLFSIPLFRQVPEPAPRLERRRDGGRERAAHRRCAAWPRRFRELRRHKDAGLLLLAFLVYNDAVNTIIRMATTFGDEIGIPAHQMCWRSS